MKILSIGSNGLLASSLGIFCQHNAFQIDVLGRSYPRLYHPSKFFIADLTYVRPKDLDSIDFHSYDLIVYAAGAGVQSYRREDTELIFAVNVTFPISLISHLKAINYMGTVVTFGSYFEIGNRGDNHDRTEAEIIASLGSVPNDYCVSKRMLTRFASSYTTPFSYFHLILPTIYAAHESSQRLIPYTISNIKSGKVGEYTTGEQIRQYVHAEDVIKTMFTLVSCNASSGIYNVPCGDTMSVKNLVTTIYQTMGVDLPPNLFGKARRDDREMRDLRLNCSKIMTLCPQLGKRCNSQRIKEYILQIVNPSSRKTSASEK